MDDETFLKHYNARHLKDAPMDAPLPAWTLKRPAVLRAWQAFHRRCHELGVPGQFDHEHLNPWDE